MKALPNDSLLDLADLDAPPAPPDYLVDGLAERGSVVLLAGDSGTGKSILSADLAISVAQGRPWLGRDVKAGRATYIDGEMSPRLALRRLRALGLRSSDEGVRYWRRPPLQLSEPDHVADLREEIEANRPDLLVFDSAITLSGCDPNDNRAVADFCAIVRRLAEEQNLVALIVHHESKQGSSGSDRSTASAARAALGAMSWRGQSDLHMALELPQNPREPRETTTNGDVLERYRVKLQLPKERDFGDEDNLEDVVIESVRTPARALLRMDVLSEGRSTVARVEPATEMREAILAALADRGEMGRADLAAGLVENPQSPGSSFTKPLAQLVGRGLVTQPRRGRYALPGGGS